MSTLLIAVLSFFGFIVAYHTYGRFIARRLFGISAEEPVPSTQLRDDIDYVPTNRFVLFGHHFTSIAGTGPIVGPAIAVLWGWLPALLWVVFGSIFIGAVHDFAALVLSLRNKGQTLGDIAGKVLSPSARILFLILLTFLLALVVAVFCTVMAAMFNLYPASVAPVWISLPMAMVLGLLVYKTKIKIFGPALATFLLLLLTIYLSARFMPADWTMPGVPGVALLNPTMVWVVILLVYCFAASVLPVWLLLQPRDFINSNLLYLAMVLAVIGLFYAAIMGKADIAASAPIVRDAVELKAAETPPIFPFLFITVACGAASGFHALVSSGTSSKQIASMKDAQFIGYGAMLVEGALAVVVIIACTAGIGMGSMGKMQFHTESPEALAYKQTHPGVKLDGHIDAFTLHSDGMPTGRDAWTQWYGGKWSEMKLGEQVAVFVEGSSNFIEGIGIPAKLAHTFIAVMIVCFAATTVDSATRLLRYVIQELGRTVRMPAVDNRFVATSIGVVGAGVIATCPGPSGYGSGGMVLWPLFGAGNQVIVGLTLLLGTVYLLRRKVNALYLFLPALVMLVIPLWAMLFNIFDPAAGWLAKKNWMLVFLGTVIVLLVVWLSVEAFRAIRRLKALEASGKAESSGDEDS